MECNFKNKGQPISKYLSRKINLISSVLCLFIGFASFSWQVLNEVNVSVVKAETIARSINLQLSTLVQLGDSIRIRQLLESIISSTEALNLQVRNGNKAFFTANHEGKVSPSSIENSIILNLERWLTLKTEREFELVSSTGPTDWNLRMVFEISLLKAALLGLLISFIASAIGFFISRFILLFAQDFVKDLSRLANNTSLISENRISMDGYSFAETFGVAKELQKKIDQVQDFTKRNALIETEMEKANAVARMVQMLAHDVRKPFSMLKTGLSFLKNSSADQAKFLGNLDVLMMEVNKATQSVDGMLSDVLEISSTSTELIQEPVSPESLIESTLGEIFRVYPEADVSVSYDLHHEKMAHVHALKVGRVFSNIVGNALQAMNYKGQIWFKTKEDGGFIEFCLGNAGSVIPQESLPKLFEAFFTSGKKGGTGLGLAIAQKVVTAHGGRIWCESSKTEEHPEGKVEFFFTLPVSLDAPFETSAVLPKHSSEVTEALRRAAESSQGGSGSQLSESDVILLEEFTGLSKVVTKPLGVLIVDDESIYRRTLASWLEGSEEVKPLVKVLHAEGSSDALALIAKEEVQLIITDIDMGPKSLSGFDLVEKIRDELAFKGNIQVHSNRIVPQDHKKAFELGADGFLPKPMSRGQLLRLILQQVYDQNPDLLKAVDQDQSVNQEATTSSNVDSSSASKVPDSVDPDLDYIQKDPLKTIAVIDDESIFRNQWQDYLPYKVEAFKTAEEFLGAWWRLKGSLIGVITDKYLGSGMDGVELGAMLRKESPDLYLFLSTNDLAKNIEKGIFDIIVEKNAFEEAEKVTAYIQKESKDLKLVGRMKRVIGLVHSQCAPFANDPSREKELPKGVVLDHVATWHYLLDLQPPDQKLLLKLRDKISTLNQHKGIHDMRGLASMVKYMMQMVERGEMTEDAAKGHLLDRLREVTGEA